MPATPARIAFVTRQFRTSVVSDPDVKGRYGELARTTGDEPVETFFDNPADALVMAAERLDLVKADRRRFRHDIAEALDFTGALDFSQGTPAATVIDDERAADHDAAIVEVVVRPVEERTTLVTWG